MGQRVARKCQPASHILTVRVNICTCTCSRPHAPSRMRRTSGIRRVELSFLLTFAHSPTTGKPVLQAWPIRNGESRPVFSSPSPNVISPLAYHPPPMLRAASEKSTAGIRLIRNLATQPFPLFFIVRLFHARAAIHFRVSFACAISLSRRTFG